MNVFRRYGLRDDQGMLHPCVAVVSVRNIETAIEKAIVPHKIPFYQILFVKEGKYEWYIEGRFYHLSAGDAILINPNEIQSSLEGMLPVGTIYFVQLELDQYSEDCGLSGNEFEYMRKLLHNYQPKVVPLESDAYQYFDNLLSAASDDRDYKNIQMQSAFLGLCALLQRSIGASMEASHISLEDANDLVTKVDAFISKHFEFPISVVDLADHCGLSAVHFRRKFKAVSGHSPQDHLNHIKMREARRRLIETSDSITDIAMDLNFSSSQHFSTSFRKTYSCGPRSYRKAFLKTHEEQSFLTSEEISSRIDTHFIRVEE